MAIKVTGTTVINDSRNIENITTINGTTWATVVSNASGVPALNDVTDVTLGTLSTGEVLQYNGSAWVNTGLDFTDIASTLADAQVVETNVTQHQAALSITESQISDLNANYVVDATYVKTDENFTTADHTKLDGIEALADVTDTLNVTQAGALMDSEVTNLADVKAFDTTDYATAAQGALADSALQSVVESAVTAHEAALTITESQISDLNAYLTSVPAQSFTSLTGKPTTLFGYGITDAATSAQGVLADAALPKAGGTMTGDIQFGSNGKVKLGTNALSLYSTGLNSLIYNQSGGLYFYQAEDDGDIHFQSDDSTGSTTDYILAQGSTGEVQLNHYGTTKFATKASGIEVTGDVVVSGNVDGRDVAADGTKLDTIETNAKDDQTGAEIKALYEAEANAYTDALNTKLSGIETSATADQTGAEIKALYEAEANAYTDALNTKLSGIETSATADQTGSEIKALYEAETNAYTDALNTKLAGIETGATADQTKADIEGLGIELPAANLTGTIAAARLDTATTQAETDDSTKIATTAFVTDKIETLIGGAPGTLNDLNELAAAINDDADYNTTLTTALGTKLPKAGGTMTGDIDMGGNKVLFNNMYATTGDLPSATTYHGMFAHVHATGKGYFAHGGAWVELANASDAYVHPSYDGDDASVDTGALTGATVISDLDFNITTDASGHVTDTNATVATRSLTLGDLGYTGETDATADQTDAEIRAAVEAATDSNVFTDADHTKLNGIAANATNVTNNNQISNGAGYITSFTNTTYSGGDGITLSGTTFNIDQDLRGHVAEIGLDGNDYIAVGTTSIDFRLDGNLDMRLENDGDLHVDGNVVAYSTTTSDERLKKDIVKIDNALDKVSQLNGYTFEYIHDGKKSGGIIAQEVEAVMPSAVSEMKLPLKSDDDQEYKVVQYDQLHGLLIEAIKELKAEIEILKG